MSQDDDELDTELPPLSDSDESYVRGLLASLPPVPVPADLAARLDAALLAEAAADAQAGTGPAAAATVVPLDARRAARGARSTRVLQVAAAGIVLVAGGFAVVKLTDNGSGQSTSAGVAAPAASAVEQAVVTHSGHEYSDETLVADVRSLATAHAPAERTATSGGSVSVGSPTATPSATSQAEQPTATSDTGGPGSAKASPVRTFLFGLASRPNSAVVACLAAVEEGLDQPVTPLAMDQGSYRGQAVLVVVLPGSQNPKTSYDVFVVGVGCGENADAHLLKYQLVEAH